MKQPLVSVIIPCHNYGGYVGEAIKSVLNQSYDHLELIVINDGSTDNSHNVISQHLRKHDFRYYKQANQGIIKTRNRGLSLAKGEYLLQLDADDYLDSNYVEETIRTAQKTNADIVYTNFRQIGNKTGISNFPDFSLEELKNHNYIHIGALFKKMSLEGFKYDRYLQNKTHEDWDFVLGLCLAGRRAALCKKTLLYYRIHSDSRNNKINAEADMYDYAQVYSYIIGKYTKKYPKKLNYISGKIFSDWYIILTQSAENKAQRITQLEKQNTALIEQRDAILESRSYKLANKISKISNKIKKLVR